MNSMNWVGGVVGIAVAASASAAVVVRSYEGGLEIARNPLGIYLDIETGEWGTSPSTRPAGWDLQFYGTSGLNFLAPEGYRFARFDSAPGTSGPSVLPYLYEIAPSMNSSPDPDFAPASWITGGAASGLIANSDQNYVGFRFVAATGSTHYGWMRFAVEGTPETGIRRLLAYGYEDVANAPISAGAVPAPGAIALLGLAAARRTRRRA